jgi:hypothetical protein
MLVRAVDETGKVQKIEKMVEEKSPNYMEVYATGIEGGPFGPYDFRMNFYEESMEKDRDGNLFLEKNHKVKVVVSYATAKQLARWINKHLDSYEKNSGHEIFIGEETSKDME